MAARNTVATAALAAVALGSLVVVLRAQRLQEPVPEPAVIALANAGAALVVIATRQNGDGGAGGNDGGK